METKPLKFTNITADIVTDADTDADVMETQLYINSSAVDELDNCITILIVPQQDLLFSSMQNEKDASGTY